MQTCYNCGKQVPDQTLICPDCGALVKRYTDAPRQQNAEREEPMDQPAVPAWQTETEAGLMPKEGGRPRFSGGFIAWLIICAVVSGYMALSYGCMLIVYQAYDMYEAMFASLPEFAAMMEMLQVLMELLEAYYIYYVLMLLAGLAHTAGAIWFLIARKRLPLMIYAAAGGILGVLMLFFVNPLYGIICLVGTLVTMFLLRRQAKRNAR